MPVPLQLQCQRADRRASHALIGDFGSDLRPVLELNRRGRGDTIRPNLAECLARTSLSAGQAGGTERSRWAHCTPSSSTSNNNVALGGITPPAPAAP